MGKYSMVMLAFLIAGMIIRSTSKPFNYSDGALDACKRRGYSL